MPNNDALPYKILIFDDQIGIDSWGEVTATQIRQEGFDVTHVSDWTTATEFISSRHVDIVVVDLDLNIRETGFDLLKIIRERNQALPVILATGNETYLDRPIAGYVDALASGPVMFYSKNSEVNFTDQIIEAANRVDPVRRSLSLMSEAGMGEKEFEIDGISYTVDELLISSRRTDELIRGLRESLQALILEMSSNAHRNL